MTINHIDFSSIDNKNSFFSIFKYNFQDLEIDEEENSENNLLFNPLNLNNNFLNINSFPQMGKDIFSSPLPIESNKMKIETSKNNYKELETNNKTKVLFQVNIFVPEPFLENQINAIIRLININKEQKRKYFLETKEINNKIYLVKNKIMLKPNERIRHLKAKNVRFENKNKDETNETIKTGRKKKFDSSIRFHNKYSLDNLFNKAKNIINKSLIEFINILINHIYSKEKIKLMFLELNIERKKSNSKLIKVIKDNQYDFIKDKKKSSDILKLFSSTVKEYLCNKLSTKYLNLPNNYNEKVIICHLGDDNYKNIFEFIFNKLIIEDWVDIFLYKKKLKDCFGFNTMKKTDQQIIKENLIGIDYYFDEIYLDNKGNVDEVYFHCLLLLIYNVKIYI